MQNEKIIYPGVRFVKAVRMHLGISRRQLSKIIDVSISTIYTYENNTSIINMSNITLVSFIKLFLYLTGNKINFEINFSELLNELKIIKRYTKENEDKANSKI